MCATGTLTIKVWTLMWSCSSFSAVMEVRAGLAETHLFIIAFIIIIAATKYRSDVSILKPAYLTRVACVGVEKRLIDCPRDEPLNYWECKNKVQVNCSKSGIFKN